MALEMVRIQFSDLSGNHKRAIATTVALLDDMLCGFEQIARGYECHSVMYRERNTLSDSQRKKLLAEITRMREIMLELKGSLSLDGKFEDLSAKIWGSSSAFWEVLVETECKHLKRYGDLPPGFAEYLDPMVRRLVDHLIKISELSRPASRKSRPRSSAEN